MSSTAAKKVVALGLLLLSGTLKGTNQTVPQATLAVPSAFHQLPADVFDSIFDFLSGKDVVSAQLISRVWFERFRGYNTKRKQQLLGVPAPLPMKLMHIVFEFLSTSDNLLASQTCVTWRKNNERIPVHFLYRRFSFSAEDWALHYQFPRAPIAPPSDNLGERLFEATPYPTTNRVKTNQLVRIPRELTVGQLLECLMQLFIHNGQGGGPAPHGTPALDASVMNEVD